MGVEASTDNRSAKIRNFICLQAVQSLKISHHDTEATIHGISPPINPSDIKTKKAKHRDAPLFRFLPVLVHR